MKQISVLSSLGLMAIILTPVTVSAQFADGAGGGQFEDLLINFLDFGNEVLLPFIIGIGFLVFVWQVFVYFIVGAADEEKRAQGKSLIIYSILAFVLIVIFYGVVNLITSSIGLEGETLDNIPRLITP